MRKVFAVVFAFVLSSVKLVLGQQESLYSQYMFNALIYNPAYTGIKGGVNINGFVRNQWAGIEGAPQTQTLSADVLSFNERSAFGGYLINDQIGVEKSTSLFMNYAYWLPLNEQHRLSFGLSGGFGYDVYEASKFRGLDPDDTFIPLEDRKKLTPDANAGLYLTNDKYYAGISVSHLISSVNTVTDIAKKNRHLYFTAGYIVPVSEAIDLYPSVLVRTDLKSPVQYDASALLLLRQTLWFGVSYRNSVKQASGLGGSENTLSMIARLQFLKNYNMGYAYDINRNMLGGTGGTHEITLSAFLDIGRVRGEGPKCYF